MGLESPYDGNDGLDEVDTDVITSNCKDVTGQCYDGERMEKLYNYYATHEGWWNNYELNNFSVGQFLGMMMLFETSVSYNGLDYVIDAATLQIWGDASGGPEGHGPYCTNVCETGVFNFLAKYVEAAWNRYDAIFEHVEHISREPIPNWNPETDRFTYPFQGYTNEKYMDFYNEKSNYIATQILNPSPADKIYTNDKAYHWGNYSNVGDAEAIYSSEGFYVFSQNQSNAAIAGGATLDQK